MQFGEPKEEKKIKNITVPKAQWPSPLKNRICSLLWLFLMSTTLVTLGSVVAFSNKNITEVYFDITNCGIGVDKNGTPCDAIPHVMEQDMEPPIYVYYHLTRFHQNYRKWVADIDPLQLTGQNLEKIKICKQFSTSIDIGVDGKILVPCGLRGWSYFNDVFELMNVDTNVAYSISEDGIAIPTNKNFYQKKELTDKITRQTKDLKVNGNMRYGLTMPDLSSERFLNWLDPAASANFYKLYGKINEKIAKGTNLEIRVTSIFNVKAYGGTKEFMLSTASQLGGKHPIFPILAFVFGCVGYLYIVAILSMYPFLTSPKE